MRKKMWLVAQAFPPVGGSHVTRVIAFVKALESKYVVEGISLIVNKGYPVYDSSRKLDIPIWKTFPGILHALIHRNIQSSQNSNKASSRLSIIKGKIFKNMKDIYRKMEIIDSYIDWLPYLAFGIRNKIGVGDLILSTSMPNTVHVATLISLIGKDNFWWADFGDPWTLNKSQPRHGFRLIVESNLEALIVRRANKLSFTTESTLKDYASKYPKSAHKMLLIRMGFDEGDSAAEILDFIKPTVFYGGSLPLENRDASEFAKVIRKMPNVNFVFSGNSTFFMKKYFENKLPDNLISIDWLSHIDFISYLRSADVSVIFGNSNYQQVPGKVYQYHAYAKKIMYISLMDVNIDESFRILNGAASIAFNDSLSIELTLGKLLNEPRGNKLPDSTYSWESTTKAMINALLDNDSGDS